MGVNTNQMAKVANTTGQLPRKADLDELTEFNSDLTDSLNGG